MASEKVEKLWELLLAGEPEVDESVEITSAMVNQQTRERMQKLSNE